MLIMKLTLPSHTTIGPDVLSPQSNKPFFQPDIWKFPSQHGKDTSAPQLGSEISPLVDMLCYPKRLPKSSGLQSSSRPYPLFHKTSVLFHSMRSQPILKMKFLMMLH
jgi:hypothetical protein